MLTPSPSPLQNLLPQFQARYPMGSLSADLLTIHQGHYVVRSIVQVGGVTLATGLASASDIEAAEDRSKVRALEGLGLGSPAPTLNGTPLVRSGALAGQPIPSASPRPGLPDAAEFPELHHRDWLSSHLPGRLTADAGASSVSAADFSEAGFSEVGAALGEPTPSDPSLESVAHATASAQIPQEVPLPSLPPTRTANRFEFSADFPLPDVPAVNPMPSLPTPAGDPSELPQLLPQLEGAQSEKPNEKPRKSAAVKAELTEATHSVATIPTRAADRSEEIAKIGIEVKRLGWSAEQGKEYLKRTYGKRSRQELSDAELLDFLHYLETQPSVMQTPF